MLEKEQVLIKINSAEENRNYFKGCKWIKIQYTFKGEAYFIKNNRRYHLNQFMRYNFDKIGFHGAMTLNNFGGMVILINDTGEAVKASYSY